METLDLQETISEVQASQKALFNLLIGFMALGLFVGIAALGVISARAVVERGEGKRPRVARFGGIPLKRTRQAVLVDRTPTRNRTERNELIQRLLADECEMCGSTENINVHHIRALRDLNVKGQREKPKWVQVMAARKRKTLVVCRTCHMNIHHGRK